MAEPIDKQELWYVRTCTYALDYQSTLSELSLAEKALLSNYTRMSLKHGGVKSSMKRESIMKTVGISLKQFNTAKKSLSDQGYISSGQNGQYGLASVTVLENAFHTNFRGKAYINALKGSQSFRKSTDEVAVVTDKPESPVTELAKQNPFDQNASGTYLMK